ncbi:MAG: nitroreductase family protein [Tetrasphaera sp.]|nr:nitroreductase family protein [Tetrasphaera sp.]
MQLTEVIARRRMTRRFDPESAVPVEVVHDLVALAIRAPSAGFSQGWDFLALLSPADRAHFWQAAAERDADGEPAPGGTGWLAGVSAAPALILCLADPTAYLDRYAEPDKGWVDRDPARWPVPYWDTDVAMAALLILLGATDRGLGSLFFGVPADRHEAVKAALSVPEDRRIVGVIALGQERTRVDGSAATRRRRPLADVLHLGRFGAPAATG